MVNKAASMCGQKGSMVVEASILMPFIILCVTALLYLPILLFSGVRDLYAVNTAAERGAVVWDNTSRRISTGEMPVEGLMRDGLYWRLGRAGNASKTTRLLEYAAARQKRYDVAEADGAGTEVKLDNYFVYDVLSIRTANTRKIPLGGLLGRFGMTGGYRFDMGSKAAINEPDEFVRNMDFLIDTEKMLEEQYPALKNLTDKSRNTLDNIKKTVSEYFD